MYHLTRLDGGLTIATAEMPHMASVSLGLWVGVGARYEPAELGGVSHFIEHLLFKGTERRSAKQISEDVEGVGGYLNAFTSEENTCFYVRAHHGKFADVLDVLMDMFLHSKFDRAEVDKERAVIKEELAMYRDQPAQHVHELLNATLWPGQPLGRSIAGTEQTLDAMARTELLAFKQSKYVAGTALVAVAGRIKHAQAVKAVARYAKKFPGGKRPMFLPATNGQTAPRVHLHTKDTEQTHLALGIRACSRHDERRFALRVLNTILGENMSSRLFQVVREDHGLAYHISSGCSHFDDTGDLVISAGLDTDKLPRALKLVMREVRRLAAAPPAAAELRRARDYLLGQTDLSLESTEHQMMWMGEQMICYGKIQPPAVVKQRLAAVTAAQVRAAARDFLRPERMNLALVSPLKKDRQLVALLNF
ncbi:MAG: insulinase family protein [Verrucomicrobia bacterium]|nr:insulinase family protein [Verrucomicrobiota bacterium]